LIEIILTKLPCNNWGHVKSTLVNIICSIAGYGHPKFFMGHAHDVEITKTIRQLRANANNGFFGGGVGFPV
jgi:hypothetical protein